MKNKKARKCLIVVVIVLIVYFLLDLINIPSLFHIPIPNINNDYLELVINSAVVIVLYIISYFYVDTKEDTKEKNSRDTIRILMQKSYNECLENIGMLENQAILENHIIPKIDFNATKSEVTSNFLNNPFILVDSMIQTTSGCYLEKDELKIYLDIKKNYQYYVNMRITFFDLNNNNISNESQRYMLKSIEKSKENANNYINGQIRKWYAEDEQDN